MTRFIIGLLLFTYAVIGEFIGSGEMVLIGFLAILAILPMLYDGELE